MIQVIRIESPEGYGIFRATDICAVADYDIYGKRFLPTLYKRHADKFPPPQRDCLQESSFEVGEDFCAFKSVEQVQKWITKREIKILIDTGYKVFMLGLNKANMGNNQVVYKKADVKKVTDITNLFI